MDPRIYEAMISGLRAQIEDLEQEIAEYENLKARKTPITIGSLEEIPCALIKVRIAKGLTQSRLARVVHLKPQQIQRYEKNDYRGVSFDRLVEIGNALGVSFEEKVKY
jgi:DNA-binding XRE family transcriptional regulator